MSRNFGIPKGVPLKVVNNRAQVTHSDGSWIMQVFLVLFGAGMVLAGQWAALVYFQ